MGRERELDLIGSVLAGEGAGVVLSGEAGVGKSRLLQAVVERAPAVELVVATRAAASVPLGAVSHLLPPGQHVVAGPGSMQAAASRLAARGTPVLLAVDDAHLLDDASAAFVHHAAVHGLATVALVVRRGEPTPDAVAAIWRDGLAQRVELEPLSEETIDALLDRALPGPVSGPARARLHRLAGGNPLYLRELLLSATESGTLCPRDGLWQWTGPLRGTERMGELVEARLAAVGPAGRAAVELVACGEPLPLTALESALDSPAGLAIAERAGLLELVEDGTGAATMVRLAHPVYGEAVRATLRPIRTRRIYQTLVEAVTEPGPTAETPDGLLRLATWQLAAGLPADESVLLPAARIAAARYDLALAERLVRRAGPEEPAAVQLLAEILFWQGRHAESVALLADDPPADLAEPARSRWVITRIGALYWGQARHGEAERALREAQAAAAIDEPSTAACRAMMLLTEGQCGPASELALAVLATEEALTDARLWAYISASGALGMMGHTGPALTLAMDGIRLADQHCGDVLASAPRLRITYTSMLMLSGRLTDARDAVERGYNGAVAASDDALLAEWAAVRGMIAQMRGDLALAVTSLRDAVALSDNHDPSGVRRLNLTVYAGALAMTGDVPAAEEALRRAGEVNAPIAQLREPQAAVNRARVAAAAGETYRAIDLAMNAAEVARVSNQPSMEAFALFDAARHGAARRVHVRLREVAAQTDSALFAAYAELAAALAARDGRQLDAVSAVFEELGSPLFAAESAAAASEAYRTAGDMHSAATSRERGRILAGHCPEARTPGLLALHGDPAGLTSREQQIALLAARPMTGPEIADRLHLSVRTVNNHLARIYTKLGISTRAQLTALLTPRAT